MAEHKHPNYMAIFYYLAILTAVELGVIFLPIPKIFIAALLCEVQAGAGLLGRRHLRQLGGDDAGGGGRLFPVVDAHRAVDGDPAGDLAAVLRRLPPVVLPLQPQPVAGRRVRPESESLRMPR